MAEIILVSRVPSTSRAPWWTTLFLCSMASRHISSKEAGNSASAKSKGIAMPKEPLKPTFSIKVLMLVTSTPGLNRSSLRASARREKFPNATSSAVTASTIAFRRFPCSASWRAFANRDPIRGGRSSPITNPRTAGQSSVVSMSSTGVTKPVRTTVLWSGSKRIGLPSIAAFALFLRKNCPGFRWSGSSWSSQNCPFTDRAYASKRLTLFVKSF